MWTREAGNKLALAINTDFEMEVFRVTMAPGTAIMGAVTPRGQGSCNVSSPTFSSCTYDPPLAAGTTPLPHDLRSLGEA